MANEVKLPALGENTAGGDVIEVKVKVGDVVTEAAEARPVRNLVAIGHRTANDVEIECAEIASTEHGNCDAEKRRVELVNTAQEAVSHCRWVVGECAGKWTQRYARGRTDADFAALIGLSEGQSISWTARDGKHHRLTVTKVKN
jgi:hypothetical protein